MTGAVLGGSPSSFAIPAPAVANGFLTRTFFDHFLTPTTIDLANSQAAGFNWYLRNDWPNATTPSSTAWNGIQTDLATNASDISVANSEIVIANAVTVGQATALSTACYANNVQGYVGQVFNCLSGFYFEFRMKANPALANLGAVKSWPIGWLMAIEFLTGAVTHHAEIDGFEMYPASPGNPSAVMAFHDWDMTAKTDNQNTNFSPSITLDANYHTYGTLYVAPGSNGGTGLIKRYYDGVEQTAQAITFSAGAGCSPGASPANPNGIYAEMATQHMRIAISAGANWPATFDYVGLWQ